MADKTRLRLITVFGTAAMDLKGDRVSCGERKRMPISDSPLYILRRAVPVLQYQIQRSRLAACGSRGDMNTDITTTGNTDRLSLAANGILISGII